MEKDLIFKLINETTKKDLDFNIKNMYNKILKEPLSFLFSKKFLIIIYSFFVFSLLAFVAFLILTIFVYNELNIGISKTVTLITFILCIILLITMCALVLYSRSFENKIRKKLHHDILKCWQIINKDSDTIIDNVTTIFSLKPDNVTTWTNKKVNTEYLDNKKVERVLIGTENEKVINIGNAIDSVSRGFGKYQHTEYDRYLFFTKEIANDYITTILPEKSDYSVQNLKKKIINSNRSIELESVEFEKVFLLDYNDPIALRKLLTPKVMNNMLELAQNSIVPVINLNKNKITLLLYYRNINLKSNVGTISYLKLSNKEDIFYQNVYDMLNVDMIKINYFKQWVKVLDF